MLRPTPEQAENKWYSLRPAFLNMAKGFTHDTLVGMAAGEETVVDSGFYAELVNFEEDFKSLERPPIILNSFDTSTEEGKKKISDLIYVRYTSDVLDVTPTCLCRHWHGAEKTGELCPKCHQPVVTSTQMELKPNLWIQVPDGVEAMVNPIMWSILSYVFTKSGCNLVEWLANRSYQPEGKKSKELEKLKQCGFERGINSFYRNFDLIMETLLSNKVCKIPPNTRKVTRELIDLHRDRIFTRWLPIPSSIAFIAESTATGTYADSGATACNDAVWTICSTNNVLQPQSVEVKENRTIKTIVSLAKYYEYQLSKGLGTKVGWWRKHVFGSRINFSYRTVITSISGVHDYNEIHLSYSPAVALFETFIIERLRRRINPDTGLTYSYKSAKQMVMEYTLCYSELIYSILCSIIKDHQKSGLAGVPSFFQRNPTLARGSAQLLYITKVFADVSRYATAMSVLCLKAPNADFDGDAMNGALILDFEMLKKAKRLAPHTGVMDLQKDRAISNNIALAPPIIATIDCFLRNEADVELTCDPIVPFEMVA